MFTLIQKRRYFFLISAAIIIPGLLVILYSILTLGSPFRLSIDFVGGSIYEVTFDEAGATEDNIREVFAGFNDENALIQRLGEIEGYRWSIRSLIQEQADSDAVLAELAQIAPINAELSRTERVSASIGAEVAQAAFWAVLVSSGVVVAFMVMAFRQVPNAFRYGICAVAAMLHDVLIVCSLMSLTGLLFGWEADTLFLTALLTVIGFSVQDTIVLFDRIRENIPKYLGEPYDMIVNRSILETIHRSLATQLNAFFIMAAILLFGGDTIKQFILILFVGLLSGTYSSIFTAVPLLVSWEKGEIPFLNRRGLASVADTL